MGFLDSFFGKSADQILMEKAAWTLGGLIVGSAITTTIKEKEQEEQLQRILRALQEI